MAVWKRHRIGGSLDGSATAAFGLRGRDIHREHKRALLALAGEHVPDLLRWQRAPVHADDLSIDWHAEPLGLHAGRNGLDVELLIAQGHLKPERGILLEDERARPILVLHWLEGAGTVVGLLRELPSDLPREVVVIRDALTSHSLVPAVRKRHRIRGTCRMGFWPQR